MHCARIIELPVAASSLDELVAIQHRHDAAIVDGELREVVRSNAAFHQALFALSDNDELVAAILRHAQMTHAIRSVTVTSPEYLHRAQQEHWTMIHAPQESDRDLLAETCRLHLLPSRDAYLQRIAIPSHA